MMNKRHICIFLFLTLIMIPSVASAGLLTGVTDSVGKAVSNATNEQVKVDVDLKEPGVTVETPAADVKADMKKTKLEVKTPIAEADVNENSVEIEAPAAEVDQKEKPPEKQNSAVIKEPKSEPKTQKYPHIEEKIIEEKKTKTEIIESTAPSDEKIPGEHEEQKETPPPVAPKPVNIQENISQKEVPEPRLDRGKPKKPSGKAEKREFLTQLQAIKKRKISITQVIYYQLNHSGACSILDLYGAEEIDICNTLKSSWNGSTLVLQDEWSNAPPIHPPIFSW